MYRKLLLCTLIFCVTFVFILPATWATPFTVTVDVSSIAGLEFELDVQLFNNDAIVGNSSVFVDNVFISDAGGVITPPGLIDFESGGLEGFAPLGPDDPVSIVSGGFTGGSFFLRLDESAAVNPTITFRTFLPSTATKLQFDFELVTPSADDSVVASILDPNNGFAAFSTIPGLFGFGDVLEATKAGNSFASGVTAAPTTTAPIPEPSSLLLMAVGVLGGIGIWMRNRRKAKYTS